MRERRNIKAPTATPRGKEERFGQELHEFLVQGFRGTVNVQLKQNLLYTLVIDENNEVRPDLEERSDPKRGQLYAFQTDILLRKVDPPIPLVVLELKFHNFSTHDVITYSSKAVRHKEVYPYLRYGFVVGGAKSISKKFLTHNLGIDFAISVSDLATEGEALIDLVTRQLETAERFVDLMKIDRRAFKCFEKSTTFDWEE